MKDLSYLTDHYDEKIKRIKEIDAPLNFIFFHRSPQWLDQMGLSKA